MASSFVGTGTSFDGEGRSFYDHIMELGSRHKMFMTEEMCYKVYVHSPFVCHHYLVLVDKKDYREHVTIELSIADTTDGESLQVTPKAQLYSGGLEGLHYKGQVCTSLEHFCEVAYRVLLDMGSYNLAFNNCQHFCDKVLKQFGLPGHTTDTTTISISAALIGVGAAAYGVYKYFSSDGQGNHGKEKRRQL